MTVTTAFSAKRIGAVTTEFWRQGISEIAATCNASLSDRTCVLFPSLRVHVCTASYGNFSFLATELCGMQYTDTNASALQTSSHVRAPHISLAINLSSSSDHTACHQCWSFKSLCSRRTRDMTSLYIWTDVRPFGKQRLYKACFTSSNIFTN
jgi:hypothetical protein